MSTIGLNHSVAIHPSGKSGPKSKDHRCCIHPNLRRSLTHPGVDQGKKPEILSNDSIRVHNDRQNIQLKCFDDIFRTSNQSTTQILNLDFPGVDRFSSSNQASYSPWLGDLGQDKIKSDPMQSRCDPGGKITTPSDQHNGRFIAQWILPL
jgi:hypothetical protein